MNRNTTTIAALALAALSTGFLAGCEADPSSPTRPKAALLPTPENQADNAFKRENEKAKPDINTSGPEFPGHSQANPLSAATVITADAACSDPSKPIPTNGTDSKFPETRYPQVNWYPTPLPQLNEHPGTTPATGSTRVPNTGWSIDHSWGEGLPLVAYPHRDWPDNQANYAAANTKHNPVYFFNIQNRLNVPQNDSSYEANHISNLYEVPWNALQILALPVMMLLENPLQQVTTQRLGHNPVYLGYLSTGGSIIPSPTKGVIKWDYPFLRVDPNDSTATTQATSEPIAPTPGITVAPPATAPAQIHEVETTNPDETPGLR